MAHASPGYEITPIDTEEGAFGFDVRRCAMADFFASQGLSQLCQEACCDVDFPRPSLDPAPGSLEVAAASAGHEPRG